MQEFRSIPKHEIRKKESRNRRSSLNAASDLQKLVLVVDEVGIYMGQEIIHVKQINIFLFYFLLFVFAVSAS